MLRPFNFLWINAARNPGCPESWSTKLASHSRIVPAIALAIFLCSLVITMELHAQTTAQEQTTTQLNGKTRKATLKELYAMFFIYSAHVENRSLADEKAGYDRTFYQHHLQQSSGLTDDEYAAVLSAAQRYVAVDTEVKSQIQQDIEAGATNGYVTNNFFQQLDSSLNDEIANVRQLLGQESAKKFEAYLQNEYIHQGYYPQPSRAEVSSPRSPSYSPTYTGSSAPQQISSPVAITTEAAPDTAIMTEATPDTVVAPGSQECGGPYYTLYESGYFDICADSQLSYVGSGQVEPYAQMYASWNNIVFDYLLIQGLFYVNGVFDNNLGCYTYYPSSTSCEHSPDVLLNSGNGALYQWYGKTSMGAYDTGCSSPGSCYETQESVDSDPAEVQIYYPDINYISPASVSPGNSGQLVIDGEYLISPFQNPPSVSIANQSANFGTFYVQSYNFSAGTITVFYSVSQSATPGTYAVTVNNGFGTDTVNLTINPPPPQISLNGSNVAGTTTANPISVMAGQQIYLTAGVPSGYSEQFQRWTINGNAVAGFNVANDMSSGQVVPVTQTNQGTLLLYWLPVDTSGTTIATATYEYCEDAAQTQCGQQTATFSVQSPTGVNMTGTPGNAELYTTNDPETNNNAPVLGFGDTEYKEWGIKFTAQMSVPDGTQPVAVFAQLVISDNEQVLTNPSTPLCKAPTISPALDKTYPVPNIDDLSAEDTPTDPVLSSQGELQRELSATMYLMWDSQMPCNTPNVGDCSIPVPLGYMNWSFNGDAINTLSVQNTPNSPLQTTNDTTFVLNACSGCKLPLTFTSTEGSGVSSVPAWGYPQWTALSDFADKCTGGDSGEETLPARNSN